MILYGKPVAERILQDARAEGLTKQERSLTVIYDEDSDKHYMTSILKAAPEWGVTVDFIPIEDAKSCQKPVASVINLAKASSSALRRATFAVDGQHMFTNISLYANGVPTKVTPCTPEAIVLMLESCYESLEGKTVAILGRSERVGKPLGLMLMSRNCTVATAHSKTPATVRNSLTQMADIVVCATGVRGLIKRYDAKWGATVVNVGGDYDETTGHEGIKLIPYKGGVGCVTTAVLMRHVVM